MKLEKKEQRFLLIVKNKGIENLRLARTNLVLRTPKGFNFVLISLDLEKVVFVESYRKAMQFVDLFS